MKKVLFTLLLLFATICSHAQVSVKYQGEVDLGYSIGVGKLSTNRANLHTVQGVKIGKYFSTGLGLGLDYYHQLYEDEGNGELFVPVFLNMKGYLPVTDALAPFISLDLGYGIGATDGVSGCDGFLWSPSIGLRYRFFKFQVGYTSQHISDEWFGFNMNAVQFKVGLVF